MTELSPGSQAFFRYLDGEIDAHTAARIMLDEVPQGTAVAMSLSGSHVPEMQAKLSLLREAILSISAGPAA